MTNHTRAMLQAILVTVIWSASWVLIKFGLESVPALTFAGLRYFGAFLCLLLLAWRSGDWRVVPTLSRREWWTLAAYGAVFTALTQGALFLALDRLPAVTTSLMLNFTPVVVVMMGIPLLGEKPSRAQWGGVALYLLGVVVYFMPVDIPARQVAGLVIALVAVLGNASSTILGRHINRARSRSPLLITTISMGIGASLLLASGIAAQGLPALRWQTWLLIAWLAVVHTAFTFTLWNHTQRTLSALETSLINNTMTAQIALLAWVFLGEALSLREIGGLVLAMAGILAVQIAAGRLATRSIPPGSSGAASLAKQDTAPVSRQVD